MMLLCLSVNTEAGNLKRHPKSIWTGVYLDDMACNQSNSFFCSGLCVLDYANCKRKKADEDAFRGNESRLFS